MALLGSVPIFRSPSVREWLRRRAHGAMVGLLRCRARPYPTGEAGVALIFAPHQDDATLGCGGMILLKRLEGVAVRIVYVTDGSASHRSHPLLLPPDLVARRRREALAAAAVLGVEEAGIRFLGAPDGTLNRLASPAAAELVEKIASLLREFRPNEIFVPCRRDGSSEHEAAFGLVARARAAAGIPVRLLEYPIWARWNPRLLFGPLWRSRRVWRVDLCGYESLKRKALAAYASQFAPVPPWTEPVLSAEFMSFFSSGVELFFETE